MSDDFNLALFQCPYDPNFAPTCSPDPSWLYSVLQVFRNTVEVLKPVLIDLNSRMADTVYSIHTWSLKVAGKNQTGHKYLLVSGHAAARFWKVLWRVRAMILYMTTSAGLHGPVGV